MAKQPEGRLQRLRRLLGAKWVTSEFVRIPPEVDPEASPIIYHYCSNDTFLSIIRNKSLWLTDINTFNDFGEMHWAYDRFIEAANKVIGNVGKIFIAELDAVISEGQLHHLPLVCAFSKESDVLSQWRAYAEDGTGVALGFRTSKIRSLAARSAQIEYSKQKQVEHFSTLLLASKEVYDEVPEEDRLNFMVELGAITGLDLACFKNPAFSEEQEVRIIRAASVSRENNRFELSDPGGNGEPESGKRLPIRFRSKGSGIAAYIELPIHGLGNDSIARVVVGPKSMNSGNEISMALSAAGFVDFDITSSSATYR